MQKFTLFLAAYFPTLVLANTSITAEQARNIRQEQIKTKIELQLNVAKPEQTAKTLPALSEKQAHPIKITHEQLEQNPHLTHQLLSQAIYSRNPDLIAKLLEVYRTLPQRDPIMVLFAEGKIAFLTENYIKAISKYREILSQNPNLNPVRIELAMALFNQKQDSAAKDQFEKAQTASDLPPQANALINAYLDVLKERDSWNVDFSFNYLRDTNVNNTGSGQQVVLENGGVLTRSEQMLPQTAHGLAYSFDVLRDFNLWGSSYLTVGNEFWGKSYWDNHNYDDLFNRSYIGYTYKTAKQNFRIKPFYEKRWYGGESYRWSNGARIEFSRWLNSNWQISTAGEFAKQRYFDSTVQNGNNKLISATLVWARTPKQFFFWGSDFSNERTQILQYSSDSKSIRLGWGQEWSWGVSSRLTLSTMKRDYKDIAKLGNINLFSFGKKRADKIYGVNLTLWKRDWHLMGITPKLQFSWRKQNSNIPEMYSYTQKNVNMVFEKIF
ncbi:surface lipoprotein assembly modifier [Haemophilus parahaemolyticus]